MRDLLWSKQNTCTCALFMYLCVLKINMKQKRIQYICQKILNQATKSEIMDFVNSKFPRRDSFFSERTFQDDIKSIKLGEFEYLNSGLKTLNKKGHYFAIKYSRSTGKYSFEDNTPVPEFNLLFDREKMTVPFLKGLLKPYESLPAVGKILHELNDIFDLTEEEIKSSAAVVVTKPEIHNSEKVHKNIIQILEHIKNENCIQFMYTTVHNLNDKLSASFMCEIIPLQIKLHENLFYLIGQNIKKDKRIVNYRIDKIKSKIEAIEDEDTGELTKFKSIDVKNLNLEQYFKNVIGVWCYNESDKTETIQIKFRDWGASYILAQPLDNSQKIVKEFHKVRIEGKEVDEIIVSIDTRLSPKIDKDGKQKKIIERSNELAFLLGRFREYAEIINE